MKYKLLKPIKGIEIKVGEVGELNDEIIFDGYKFVDFLGKKFSDVEFMLLEHCGFIEEVKEWKADELKFQEEYYFINSMCIMTYTNWENDNIDKFRLKTNNIFQSKEDAEKRLKEIIES